MVMVMFVVNVEEGATDRIVLLNMAGEYVGLRSRVMLGNSMERGIATFMPMIRAMQISYILKISINW